MAFSGNVACMGLDHVVQFLAQNGVEGALTVMGAAASIRVYLAGGRVLCPIEPRGRGTGSFSPAQLDAIVHRAEQVRQERRRTGTTGKIDRETLNAVFDRARAVANARQAAEAATGKLDAETLEDLLRRAEQLTRDERHASAAEQIHQVFTWEAARFEFQPGPVPPGLLEALRQGEGLVLDARVLIMEVARRADERKRLPVVGPHGTRMVERPRSARHKRPAPREKSLQGDLRGVGLAPVLQALRSQRHTGTLSVTAAGREEQLFFRKGEVFVLRRESAEPDEFARSFLGDATGQVEDLVRSSLEARQLSESDLTAEQVRAAKDQFLELLFWDGAEFAFFEGCLPRELEQRSPDVSVIALESDRFLMEAIQRLGEWDAVRRTLGDGDPVLRFVDFEWKLSAVRGHERADLLTLIDGRRSLEDLVRQTGSTHLEVARVLVPLVAAGSLEVIPRPAPAPQTSSPG